MGTLNATHHNGDDNMQLIYETTGSNVRKVEIDRVIEAGYVYAAKGVYYKVDGDIVYASSNGSKPRRVGRLEQIVA